MNKMVDMVNQVGIWKTLTGRTAELAPKREQCESDEDSELAAAIALSCAAAREDGIEPSRPGEVAVRQVHSKTGAPARTSADVVEALVVEHFGAEVADGINRADGAKRRRTEPMQPTSVEVEPDVVEVSDAPQRRRTVNSSKRQRPTLLEGIIRHGGARLFRAASSPSDYCEIFAVTSNSDFTSSRCSSTNAAASASASRTSLVESETVSSGASEGEWTELKEDANAKTLAKVGNGLMPWPVVDDKAKSASG